MIVTLLIILWLVFGVMTVVSLYYKQYHQHQILGITFSKAHAQHPDVREITASFTKACIALLVLSIACSLLLFVPLIKGHAEFVMLLLLILNLFFSWLIIDRYQKKLTRLKEENRWIYPKQSVVAVDLKASAEKGKSGVPSFWVWLFFVLSFAPTVFLAANSGLRELYPIGFSFIGPLCQLLMVFLYYQMKNRRSRLVTERTEATLLFMKQEERINSLTGTLTALAMLIFWILFNTVLLQAGEGLLIISPVVFLIIAILFIALWQQRRLRDLENAFSDELPEDAPRTPGQGVWKWGAYYNPDDPRIFVPKRVAGMGWTVNIGRPAGKAVFAGFMVMLAVIIGFVVFAGSRDYKITVQESSVIIDAAMYDTSFDKSDVLSVTVTERLPSGRRTSGYGGSSKSFGHFYLDGYGRCMVYVYHKVGKYVVVDLEGNNPDYVIFNEKTPQDTEMLYQTLLKWLSEK